MKGKNLRLWGLPCINITAMWWYGHDKTGIKLYYNFHKAYEELGEFYENPNAPAGTG
jgi:hypothetical protein